jgi:hypothetical protein
LKQQTDRDIRVFVVWEPVLPTDWMAPSTNTMGRIPDSRARQYWDKGRLLSKTLGEKDKGSIVWDAVLVYQRSVTWTDAASAPKPLSAEGPVLDVISRFTAALRQALEQPR